MKLTNMHDSRAKHQIDLMIKNRITFLTIAKENLVLCLKNMNIDDLFRAYCYLYQSHCKSMYSYSTYHEINNTQFDVDIHYDIKNALIKVESLLEAKTMESSSIKKLIKEVDRILGLNC